MSKSITVNYDGKPKYNILIEKDFSRLNEYIDSLGFSKKKICIITDSNITDIFLDELKESLPDKRLYTHTIPAGEANKNLNTVKDIYTTLVKNNFERGDLLIALGGGVVGDICGFTAATYLRGISFIQIPTSLLAQVDSSIGGKTGVDFDSYKNMVGAFYMPALVYINVSTLLSLPDSEFISGMGEVVKHGLILDFDYYKWIVSNADDIKVRNLDALEYMIYQSDIIKASVVEEDPFEKGRRRLLNFGHTLGHAIEKEYNLKLSHGICVAPSSTPINIPVAPTTAAAIITPVIFIANSSLYQARKATECYSHKSCCYKYYRHTLKALWDVIALYLFSYACKKNYRKTKARGCSNAVYNALN